MLLTILHKEIQEIGRDPVLCGIVATYVALLGVCCIASHSSWLVQSANQSMRQSEAREEWLTQPNSSPHQATHRGTTVYKLPSPLASVDPGVSSELGTSIRLEAHRRHDAVASPRQDQVRLFQLEFNTPALLVQAVLPLVVMVVSSGIVSREREQGTCGLLSSLAATPWQVLLGKWLAVFCLAVLLVTPLLLTLIWIALQAQPQTGMPWPEVILRACALSAITFLYLGMWCWTGVTLSARYSSGTTLVLLICCWAVWTLIIPRLGVDLAYSRFPAPSPNSLAEIREAAIRQGTDGQRSLQDFNAALERRLLREFGVSKLEDLPINLKAARLLSNEEFTNAIDDQTLSILADVYRNQHRFLRQFELLSPYLAIRSVSTACAGTDLAHHDAFVASAESYRRRLVKTMNTAEMQGKRPAGTAETAREFWSQVPAFVQTRPELITLFRGLRWPLFSLLAWSGCMLLLALSSRSRIVQ